MPEVPAPISRPVPPRVGRYEVLLPIASGGMATVYLARSQGARGFVRDVALKLTHAHLRDETSEFAAILLEEARIASRIKHRNVVSILDVGEDPLGLFLVMDYVEGDTLAGLQRAALARSEPLPPRIGVRILLDALAGLHAAHELHDPNGKSMAVVHRDFSPQNILIGLDGVAQLADFGIAKAADRTGETATGVVKGKVAYMSPEHARSQPIDRRADVWSAGVVAWEIFAGHRLHASNKDGLAILLKVVSERPALLSTEVKDTRREVEEVVSRALEPDVDARCPTAAVFARDLAKACEQAGEVASHEEVAEYVKRISGPKLEKRRAQVNDSLKLRANMAALAEASVTESSQQTPLNSEPDAASPQSKVSSDVAPWDLPSPAIEQTVPSSPSVLSSPSALTETSSASDALRASLSPKGVWSSSRGKWVGGGLGLALVGGLALVLIGRGSGHTTEVARVSATATAASASASAEGTPPSIPPPDPLPAVDANTATTSSSVHVHASARIGSLRVNTRAIALAAPASDVTFQRAAEDGTGPVTILATSVDGRKRMLTLSPGSSSIDIDFPAFSQAPQRSPGATPARPSSPSSPRKESGDIPPNPFSHPSLPANPYGPP